MPVVSLDEVDVFAEIAAARRDLADTLDTLDAQQWEAPSLCAGWRVRDVVAHLTGSFHVSTVRFVFTAIRSGGFNRAVDRLARARGAAIEPSALVADLRANAEHRFAPPGIGPSAPLADVYIHAQDIRRPLGLAATSPAARTCAVLDFLTGRRAFGFVPKGRLAGLHLEATDLDWRSGTGGSAVRGPGEALALAVTGRSAALADLAGDGLTVLRGRLRA